MGMSRVSFTIPDEFGARLKKQVPHQMRSAFVAAAIRERLQRIEDEALSRELREGYLARREEDAGINAEWEAATLESWQIERATRALPNWGEPAFDDYGAISVSPSAWRIRRCTRLTGRPVIV